jgi:hypothetical protein
MLSFYRGTGTSSLNGVAPSRRNFLIAMVETGIALGYVRSTLAAVALPSAGEHMAAAGDRFEPTIWYAIDRDGAITINAPGGDGPACRYRTRPHPG